LPGLRLGIAIARVSRCTVWGRTVQFLFRHRFGRLLRNKPIVQLQKNYIMANHRRGQRDSERSSWQNRSDHSPGPYYSESQRSNERYGDNTLGRPYGTDYPYTERNYNQDHNYPYGTGSRAQSNYRGGTYEGGYSNPDYRHADDHRQSSGYDRYRSDNGYNNEHRRTEAGRMDYRHNEFENPDRGEHHIPWDRTNEGNARWSESNPANSWERQRNERNERSSGQFRGKGPKGYKRSDERIKEDISDRLADHDDIDASEIEVTVTSGEVILSGTVNDRYEKRVAEECAERVSGVVNVENRIRLQQQPQGTDNSGERSGSSKTNYTAERTKTKNHIMNES
jgi:osmotically-inducible protein OsmY